MTMIDDIKRDREAGTPGPWHFAVNSIVTDGARVLVGKVWRVWDRDNEVTCHNARRIARVPDMEAALLAAEEIVDRLDCAIASIEDSKPNTAIEQVGACRAFLAAYRKATEGK